MFGKFLKGIFYLLPVWIIIIMLFSFNQSNIKTKAGAIRVSSDTKIVNFYGADNKTIIASYEVPYGKTLNDFNNSVALLNDDFSLNSNGLSIYEQSTYNKSLETVDNWYIINWSEYGDVVSLEVLEDGSLFIGTSASCRLFQDIYKTTFNFYDYLGETFTTSFKINGIVNSYTFTVQSSGNLYNQYFNNVGVRNLITPYTNLFTFGFTVYDSQPKHFEWVKIEQGNTATPYFTPQYLEKLYNNTGNSLNGLVWSQSLYTNIKFDYDTPITQNLDLYAVEDKRTFTFTNSWHGLFSNVERLDFLTFNTFERFTEYTEKLRYYQGSNTGSNFIDALNEIWFTLSNLFMIIINFALLFIAPFIDFFAIIIALLWSGLSFWV